MPYDLIRWFCCAVTSHCSARPSPDPKTHKYHSYSDCNTPYNTYIKQHITMCVRFKKDHFCTKRIFAQKKKLLLSAPASLNFVLSKVMKLAWVEKRASSSFSSARFEEFSRLTHLPGYPFQ